MKRGIEIQCVSEAVSPITHMSGTAGNEAIIAREKVVTPQGVRYIPFLSGNALRHRAVREPGMLWLIDEYELRGKLTAVQLNFLLHGGNLTESNAHENTRRIAELHRTWPLMRLLGGSLPNQILSGFLDVWRGVLACEENRTYIGEQLDGPLYGAEYFVSGYQYTRGDAAKLGEHKETLIAPDNNMMIFAGQSVSRGALFLHGFSARIASEIELGALLWSLRLWQSQGGTIGGQASRGHGRLKLHILGDFDQPALCGKYVEYARSVKDDAVAWLEGAFK